LIKHWWGNDSEQMGIAERGALGTGVDGEWNAKRQIYHY
jgi:hypothetical protein